MSKSINEIHETDSLNVGRKKINNAIKAFNETVVEGDSSVEAAQARVDAEGKSFPTLKARLDEKETKFAAQLAQTEQGLIYVQSEVAKKANENEARMKRDKIEPEDLSLDTLELVTGEGTINLESIPQDGSVTPQKTSDIAGLNMYPFQRKAILSEDETLALQLSRSIIDVKLYNTNELINYRIGAIRKSFFRESVGYEWGIYIFEEEVGGQEVARFRHRTDTLEEAEGMFTGIQKIELGTAYGSGITGEIIINWDALPDGLETRGNSYEKMGLDRRTTTSELAAFMTTENEEWVI